MISTVLIWMVLITFISFTIGGNVLVCLAVCASRRLRRITNCFVVSLAVTDLLLGLLVLPLSAILELNSGHWPLGRTFCNIYLSIDVTLCTSSIFTLLAISVDRYQAISAPLSYTRRLTPRRAAAAISFIWIISMSLAFVPVHMGWNMADFKVLNQDWRMWGVGEEGRTCRYEWNNNFVLLTAFGLFFLPLLVMCGMYRRIFCVARDQVNRIRATTPSITRASSTLTTLREHKATVTLASVLSAFIICWMPYFLFLIYMGLRQEAKPPDLAHSVVLWLGYFNSALNPILYPTLNRDFRRAYSQLLHCRNIKSQVGSSLKVTRHVLTPNKMVMQKHFHP